MKENVEKLKSVKEALEGVATDHAEILDKEPSVAHLVHQAKDEARRRFKAIGGDTDAVG